MTSEEDLQAIADLYRQNVLYLEAANAILVTQVQQLLRTTTSNTTVRFGGGRVKTLDSVLRSSQRRNLSATKFFELHDLVGCRIICHSQSAVEEVIAHLSTLSGNVHSIRSWRYENEEFDGYRGVHVYTYIAVPTLAETVTGEIQVRTVLQDAWSELTHAAVYKGHDVPELIRHIFVDLSAQLNVAQRTADRLRQASLDAARHRERAVRPLTLQIDAIVTVDDVQRYREVLVELQPYLGASWSEFLMYRLEQRSGQADLGALQARYMEMSRNRQNDDELRALAFLAACEIPDKGFGGDIPALVERLRVLIEQSRGLASPLAADIEGECWFWIGELQRHDGNTGDAARAYRRAAERRSRARSLHRLALLERLHEDEERALALLRHAGVEVEKNRLIAGEIQRDLGIAYLRKHRREREVGRAPHADELLQSAEGHLMAALQHLDATVDVHGAAITRVYLAEIASLRGRTAEAEQMLVEQIDTLEGHPLFAAQALARLCAIRVLTNHDCTHEIERLHVLDEDDRIDEARHLQIAKYVAHGHIARAQQFLRRGDIAHAADDLLQAMRFGDKAAAAFAGVRHEIARVLRHAGGVAALRRELERRDTTPAVPHVDDLLALLPPASGGV